MEIPELTWPRALAWRLRQQFLDPVPPHSVAEVVGRLGAVQAGADPGTELSVNTRRASSRPGDVAAALAEGTLIKTFAFRGATHLMTAEDAGVYLALRSASRMWELPSWQQYYKLKPADWPDFEACVRDALADGPLTRMELGTRVAATPRFAHPGSLVAQGNWTLLKPLAWHGVMSFGPPIAGAATFQRLDGNPRWKGIPALDEAGMRAVEAYARAYGPATLANLEYWLGAGLGAGGRRLQRWIDRLGERLAWIRVEGEDAFVLSEDRNALLSAEESDAVRLLPSFDQWILGPGTSDPHVTPPGRRALVTRHANLVIARGVLAGTWTLREDVVSVTWFEESGGFPHSSLAAETERLATIVGRPLRLAHAAAKPTARA